MKIQCTVGGGGIFAKIIWILKNIEKNILDLEEIENIEVVFVDERIDSKQEDPISYICEHVRDVADVVIQGQAQSVSLDIIPATELARLKVILSKLKVRQDILNRADQISNQLGIDQSTLGVHVRLTDMNAVHGDLYGNVYFEDFVNKIEEVRILKKYSKLFVACDNNESIRKLKDIYGEDLLFYPNFIRLQGEADNLMQFTEKNLGGNRQWWQDTFVEMLLLSRCGGLIHRVSDFANITKIYSNTIKEVFFIKGKY